MSQNNYLFQRSSNAERKQSSFVLHLICMIMLALVLTACGGGGSSGGGSGATPTGTPTPNTPPDPNGVPDPVDPGPGTPPPVNDQALFEAAVYPMLAPANPDPLVLECVDCHSGNPRIGTPDISHPDPALAYGAVVGQSKVNLANPAMSRLYVRAAVDRHNCGGIVECDAFAGNMLAAIQTWAAAANAGGGNPGANIVASAATNFSQSVEGSIPRADANVITTFNFSEGAGTTTAGTSNVGADMVLNLEGTEWVAEGGLRNVDGKAQASLTDSQKLFNILAGGNQFSVEAWVIPEADNQTGPARIVSYSIDTGRRNFTLGQTNTQYISRVQTLENPGNGSNPELRTEDGALNLELTHVVMTYDNMQGGRKLYVNGQLAAEEAVQGDMLNWQDDNFFILGNEATNNRLWRGIYKMVAIHNTALNGAEVAQNFNAGAGAITSLRFDVANVLGAPGYIEMQASMIDPFAYVFSRPMLVSDVNGVAVKNIRVAVNNNVPVAAQAFRRVDTTVNSGQEISPWGALIPADLGMELDQFHLEFAVLGGQTGSEETMAPPTPPAPPADVLEPDTGVRTFSQVHDTMSALTGISQGDRQVRDRYDELKDQLPPNSNVLGFGAAQQIAIQRLATTYCQEVVGNNNNATCRNFFNDNNCAIAAGEKDAIAGVVYDKIIGNNLANQPDRTATTAELVQVMNDLNCVNGCNGAEGRTVLQAVCASALASSAVTLD